MNRLQELGDRIDSRQARIGVIGLGYVGLPLALEFARAGFDVTGLEIDAEKVRLLEEGISYIEDISAEVLAEARNEGRFHATTNSSQLTRLDVINICVPTPLTRTRYRNRSRQRTKNRMSRRMIGEMSMPPSSGRNRRMGLSAGSVSR